MVTVAVEGSNGLPVIAVVESLSDLNLASDSLLILVDSRSEEELLSVYEWTNTEFGVSATITSALRESDLHPSYEYAESILNDWDGDVIEVRSDSQGAYKVMSLYDTWKEWNDVYKWYEDFDAFYEAWMLTDNRTSAFIPAS